MSVEPVPLYRVEASMRITVLLGTSLAIPFLTFAAGGVLAVLVALSLLPRDMLVAVLIFMIVGTPWAVISGIMLVIWWRNRGMAEVLMTAAGIEWRPRYGRARQFAAWPEIRIITREEGFWHWTETRIDLHDGRTAWMHQGSAIYWGPLYGAYTHVQEVGNWPRKVLPLEAAQTLHHAYLTGQLTQGPWAR